MTGGLREAVLVADLARSRPPAVSWSRPTHGHDRCGDPQYPSATASRAASKYKPLTFCPSFERPRARAGPAQACIPAAIQASARSSGRASRGTAPRPIRTPVPRRAARFRPGRAPHRVRLLHRRAGVTGRGPDAAVRPPVDRRWSATRQGRSASSMARRAAILSGARLLATTAPPRDKLECLRANLPRGRAWSGST